MRISINQAGASRIFQRRYDAIYLRQSVSRILRNTAFPLTKRIVQQQSQISTATDHQQTINMDLTDQSGSTNLTAKADTSYYGSDKQTEVSCIPQKQPTCTMKP